MSTYFCATCEGYSPVGATLREVFAQKLNGCVCIVSTFPFFKVAFLFKFDDYLN